MTNILTIIVTLGENYKLIAFILAYVFIAGLFTDFKTSTKVGLKITLAIATIPILLTLVKLGLLK